MTHRTCHFRGSAASVEMLHQLSGLPLLQCYLVTLDLLLLHALLWQAVVTHLTCRHPADRTCAPAAQIERATAELAKLMAFFEGTRQPHTMRYAGSTSGACGAPAAQSAPA